MTSDKRQDTTFQITEPAGDRPNIDLWVLHSCTIPTGTAPARPDTELTIRGTIRSGHDRTVAQKARQAFQQIFTELGWGDLGDSQ